MYRAHGARLRLNFSEDADDDTHSSTSRTTGPGQNYLTDSGAAWNPQANYWDDLPPSPRKVQASTRKCPASPRRVPYAARKPKSRVGAPPPLHLQAHDSILGAPLGDSHGPVYPMHCSVFLQPCTEGQRYVLIVVIYRDDLDTDSFAGNKVAASSVTKNMRPGKIMFPSIKQNQHLDNAS